MSKGEGHEKQDIYELATVIRWTPPGRYPENARYVLIRYYDEELEERTFGFGSFENGVYSLAGFDGKWQDLSPKNVIGWSYPIYEK